MGGEGVDPERACCSIGMPASRMSALLQTRPCQHPIIDIMSISLLKSHLMGCAVRFTKRLGDATQRGVRLLTFGAAILALDGRAQTGYFVIRRKIIALVS
jgi:hypothetical protein